jgi:uncharacterized protein with GYD domain
MFIMATYVVLGNFTDQGIRSVKDTTKRADALKDLAKSFGVTMKGIYWTLGQYDTVAIIDAPDEMALTAFGLAFGKAGNHRTQTLRAFSQAEMDAILTKIT